MISLATLTKRIVASQSNREIQKSVMELYNFFNEQGAFLDMSDDDIALEYGYALSVKHASDCIKDYKRTHAFTKGVYQAIEKLRHEHGNSTLRILYAGSGPYAPLVLPLLFLYKEEEIDLKVTIIDINTHSVSSVKNLVKLFGIERFMEKVQVADAINYQDPDHKGYHLIVTETMFHALTREPQVAITRNLKDQLREDGIFIPEEIHISMGYSFFSKEPYLNQFGTKYEVKNQDSSSNRKGLQNLFSLTKSSVLATDFYESDWIEFKLDKQTPDLCIFTKIQVYKDIELKDSDSLITNPLCIKSLSWLARNGIAKFKLIYSLKESPKWTLAV